MSTAEGEAPDDGFDKVQSTLFWMGVVADDQVAEIVFKIELEGGIGSDEMVDCIGGEAPKRVCSLGWHCCLSTKMRYSEVVGLGNEIGEKQRGFIHRVRA